MPRASSKYELWSVFSPDYDSSNERDDILWLGGRTDRESSQHAKEFSEFHGNFELRNMDDVRDIQKFIEEFRKLRDSAPIIKQALLNGNGNVQAAAAKLLSQE